MAQIGATPRLSRPLVIPGGSAPGVTFLPGVQVRGKRSNSPAPLQINRDSPAGRAVVSLIPFGRHNFDLATNIPVTFASSGAVIQDASQWALRSLGTSAAASIPINLSAYSNITVSFWLYWDAYANNDALAMEHGTNFTTSHGFLIDPNSGAPFAGSFQVGSNGIGRSFSRPTVACWHHYICRFNSQGGSGTDVDSVHVDGIAQSLSATAGSPAATNFGNNTLYLFSRAGSTLLGAGRLRNLVIRAQYVLTSDEILREYKEPWSIFSPASADIWLPWS